MSFGDFQVFHQNPNRLVSAGELVATMRDMKQKVTLLKWCFWLRVVFRGRKLLLSSVLRIRILCEIDSIWKIPFDRYNSQRSGKL